MAVRSCIEVTEQPGRAGTTSNEIIVLHPVYPVQAVRGISAVKYCNSKKCHEVYLIALSIMFRIACPWENPR
jgi:hypothetical protein